MDAVILAAGLGTRLRPRTADHPRAATGGARPADPRLDPGPCPPWTAS